MTIIKLIFSKPTQGFRFVHFGNLILNSFISRLNASICSCPTNEQTQTFNGLGHLKKMLFIYFDSF